MIRTFRLAILAALSLASSVCTAQGKMPRICFLTFDPGSTLEAAMATRYRAFFEALKQLGYVPQKSIHVDYLSAEGKNDRFPSLAAECVRLKADVIVAATTPGAQAAKRATTTIPIVMHPLGDPVGTGLVRSLSQPGGNLTGLTFMAPAMAAKRLELLKEAFPQMKRVLVLSYMTDPIGRGQVEELKKAAPKLNVQLIVRDIKVADDYPVAFDAAMKEGADGLLVTQESISLVNRVLITGLATRHRLPAVYWGAEFLDAGGLMSYESITNELRARTADFVDRILKGAKPADMPIEQPSKFTLIVNMQAAKVLGLTIPSAIQMRADKVLQ